MKAYQLAPEVTRERLYLETMELVLENTSKIVMGSQQSNNLMMLPLEQIFSGKRVQPLTDAADSDSHNNNVLTSDQESILRNTIKERMNENQRPSPVVRDANNNQSDSMNNQTRSSSPRTGLRSGY